MACLATLGFARDLRCERDAEAAEMVGGRDAEIVIWGFPEIGVPPNHPNFNRIFPYKPSILGIPHSWKAPVYLLALSFRNWDPDSSLIP